MGEILKILGQVTPTANTLRTLYTVPTSYSAVISSISVCNQNSSSNALFRVAIAKNGASDAPEQYLYFDLPLVNNDTFIATIGISLAAGDVVRIQSSVANVSFNLMGVEVGVTTPPPANAAGGDLSGFYPNPAVAALQGNLVASQFLGTLNDGYVLTWDNTDGYWKADSIPTPATIASPVIFDESSGWTGSSKNLRSDRPTHQSIIDNTLSGIVNLSSDTSTNGNGVRSDFSSIVGGDQNNITTQSEYGVVAGGLGNEIIADSLVSGSGAMITVNSVSALTGSGLSITAQNGLVAITGYGSIVGAIGYTITITGAASPNNNGSFIILGANTIGVGNGYTYYNPLAPQGTDANNGSISTTGSNNVLSTSAGFTPNNQGGTVTISGAADPNNNGTFLISGYGNTSLVFISNPNASTDANNGALNYITGSQFSIITSGQGNFVNGAYSAAINGCYNTVSGNNAIVGGQFNQANGSYSVCIGGSANQITNVGMGSVVCGGSANLCQSANSTIIGGFGNSISVTSDGSMSGGNSNFISGLCGTTFGIQNSIFANYGTICGGQNNNVSGAFGTVIGGLGNVVGGAYCVAGGSGSYATGQGSLAFGLGGNRALNSGSVALGFASISQRDGELAMSSTGDGLSQFGMIAIGGSGSNTTFNLQDAANQEFHVLNSVVGPSGNNYYSIQIRIVAAATNVALGPAVWTYEAIVYTASGIATIMAVDQIYNKPANGWLSSVTVSGLDDILHISINTNTDTTSIVQATAFLQWAQVKAFTQ